MLQFIIAWLILACLVLALMTRVYYVTAKRLAAWQRRLNIAPDMCGYLWCLKTPNDPCHFERDETISSAPGIHRYRSARLVLLADYEILRESKKTSR